MAKTLEARLDKQGNTTLAAIYNLVAERPVSKFSDHSTAVKRTLAALEARSRDFVVGDDGLVRLVDAGATPRSGRDGDERTITVVAEKNPKAKGSKSERRFALYRTGMTVGEYITAASKLGGGRRKAVRDLTWDSTHDFIKIG